MFALNQAWHTRTFIESHNESHNNPCSLSLSLSHKSLFITAHAYIHSCTHTQTQTNTHEQDFNAKSESMTKAEIDDLMARRRALDLEVSIT